MGKGNCKDGNGNHGCRDNQRGAKTGVSGSTESCSLNINSTNFRILFRNSIYNITGLIPLYDHNNYLKIESEIRKAGVSDDFR